MVRMDTLVLCLTLEGMLFIFTIDNNIFCWLIIYGLCYAEVESFMPTLWSIIIINWCLISLKAFSASIEIQFSSLTQSCLTLWDPMKCSKPGLPVHHQLPEFTHSCPMSWWCHPTISFSAVPFFSCLQSSPKWGSFQMSQFVTSGGQNIGVSASTSVLPMNTKEWFPLRRTGWISLQSKGFSRVFSSTTVQKHQFFGAQLSLQSNSHIHKWLLEKV